MPHYLSKYKAHWQLQVLHISHLAFGMFLSYPLLSQFIVSWHRLFIPKLVGFAPLRGHSHWWAVILLSCTSSLRTGGIGVGCEGKCRYEHWLPARGVRTNGYILDKRFSPCCEQNEYTKMPLLPPIWGKFQRLTLGQDNCVFKSECFKNKSIMK